MVGTVDPSLRRVCILTGAGGELGNTFCSLFAEHYNIVAVCRNRVPYVSTQKQAFVDPLRPMEDVAENSSKVYEVRADLNSDSDLERVVEASLARFGRIDLVVNAAADMDHRFLVESGKSVDALKRQAAVNIEAPLRLALLTAKMFWRARDLENSALGRGVINISSISGMQVFPNMGQSSYSASKAGLNFLTMHLADEFRAFGIKVNAIAPDAFPSRIATSRVAEAIVRLDSSEVTGKILVIEPSGEQLI
ncbi:MAG: SDR family NAD(P)-dependent oxidoreductase [Armatimonadetes bacterium]|nr:SDR family NAD(P)-dependent oxidoreductase [Armatimonadota bacterium]